MQPNQQDPYQQQSTPYTPPTNVPEYLHLDPVQGPAPKRSLKKIILIVLLAAVLVGLATAVALFVGQASPEQRFYSALENAMNTPYISRKISAVSDDAKTKLVAEVESDFSDVDRPKTKFSYTYTQPTTVTNLDEGSFTVRTNVSKPNASELYGKLAEAPADTLGKNIKLDQWYKLSISGFRLFDPMNLGPVFDSAVSQIPIGNFDATETKKLIEYINKEKIYTLKQSRSESLGGRDATLYTVTIDKQKLANLASVINSKYSEHQYGPLLNQVTDNTYEILIDNKTNQFMKISYETRPTDEGSVKNVVEFEYVDSVMVEVPISASALTISP